MGLRQISSSSVTTTRQVLYNLQHCGMVVIDSIFGCAALLTLSTLRTSSVSRVQCGDCGVQEH